MAGYNLYRSGTTGGPYTKVNASLITGTTYSDSGLIFGTTYYYVLRAVDTSANESANSGEVNVSPLVSAGAALSFDGTNDYVTFGDVNSLDLSQFTLEGWFRRDGAGTPTTTGSLGIPAAIPLISNGAQQAENSNVDINYILCIDTATNTLCADFEEGAGGTGHLGLNHPVYGTTVIQNGVWYHAAATYDGSRWKLYLNGHLEENLIVGQPANAANTVANALSTSLNETTTNGFFNGAMDEVRIWNVVRNQQEIQGTINSELTSGTGLVARWGINEGTGTSIASSVGTIPQVH